MKNWENAELSAITISATSNQPTKDLAVDDLQNGVFTFGVREGSGPVEHITYVPGKN